MIDDPDFAYDQRRQERIDQMDDDAFIALLTKGKGLPPCGAYEERKLSEREQ